MIFRYLAFDPTRHARKDRFHQLRSAFNLLLTKTAGDVDEALEWLRELGARHRWFDESYEFDDFVRDLLGDGTVERDRPGGTGGLKLTGKGERTLRESALERVFTSLATGSPGDHRTPHAGGAGDETEDTRPWAFGDPIDQVAWTPTLRNALGRMAADRTPGAPRFRIREDDIEIREREAQTGCATVLLLDISHSMVLYGEDRMMKAREVALALHELITNRYEKDTLDLVLFGDDAEHVPLHRIPYVQAGPYHTNTKAGLQMALDILRSRRHANRQIFLVTDGKPSALWRDGSLYKNPFGLDDEIVNRTLDEALRCRKAGVTVTTFMVAADPVLVSFVEDFTRRNRGRAYFTGTNELGATLFVDYLRNRRTRV